MQKEIKDILDIGSEQMTCVKNETKIAMAKEIDTLTKEHYFEFAEWFKQDTIFVKCSIDGVEGYLDTTLSGSTSTTTTDRFYTRDGLINFWITNYKNK